MSDEKRQPIINTVLKSLRGTQGIEGISEKKVMDNTEKDSTEDAESVYGESVGDLPFLPRLPQHPSLTPSPGHCFWSVARAIWLEYDADSPLVLTLIEWASRQHKKAFDHLAANLGRPAEIRATLGGIARRMRENESVAFLEASSADPYGLSVLQPYIDKAQTPDLDARLDRAWRGVRDDADRICMEYLKNHPRKTLDEALANPIQPQHVEQPEDSPERAKLTAAAPLAGCSTHSALADGGGLLDFA